jgi:HicB family
LRPIVRFDTRRYDDIRVSAQPSPSPVSESRSPKTATPSGRLLLRMPPGLHGELTRAAERDGTSLNGYIIARLGEAVGRSPEDGAPTEPAASERSASRTLTWLLVANVVAVALAGLAAVVILLVAAFD